MFKPKTIAETGARHECEECDMSFSSKAKGVSPKGERVNACALTSKRDPNALRIINAKLLDTDKPQICMDCEFIGVAFSIKEEGMKMKARTEDVIGWHKNMKEEIAKGIRALYQG